MELESELKARFSNVFIMLLYSVITKDLNKVKHFISDDVCNKYQNIIDTLIKNNETQLYDELNVGEIRILKQETTNDKVRVNVQLEARYLDYIVDSEGNFKRGNDKHRVPVNYYLIFEKDINAESKNFYRCANCGNNLDINFTGECPYCNNVADVDDFEYQLVSIEKI